jgi:hypothetical protein
LTTFELSDTASKEIVYHLEFIHPCLQYGNGFVGGRRFEVGAVDGGDGG